MRPVRWLDMTPEEFIEARAERPVAYVPFGHAEAHGVVNALGMDWYCADSFCVRMAEKYKGIACPGFQYHVDEEPYMNWGINSCKMGEQFCSGISNSLFLHNMLYQIRLLDARKFKAGLLIGGHAVPNLRKDAALLIEYYKMMTGSPIQLEYLVYLDLDKQAKKRLFPNERIIDGHAGFVETALLMAFKPELAHPELLGTEARYPESGGGREGMFDAYCAPHTFGKNDGQLLPTAERGEMLIQAYLESLGKRADELLSAYDEADGRPEAPNFDELEGIWAGFYEATFRYWGSHMSYVDYEEKRPMPVFPGWDFLGIKGRK